MSPLHRIPRLTAYLGCSAIVIAAVAACGSKGNGSRFGDGGTSSHNTPGNPYNFLGDGSASMNGGDGSTSPPPPEPDTKVPGMMYGDFPSAPVIDAPDGGGGTPAPASAPTLFGPAGQGATSGGPCLVEPEVGALYPDNWLRPRFRWIAGSGENLFELRLHVANQKNDLVVYTTSNEWTMPRAQWDLLRADSYDENMTVTVRGGVLSGTTLGAESIGSSGSIGIAPVNAPGTIVYWTVTNNTALKGFAVGDEGVTPVLTPGQVQEYSVSCIGCHNSTPDGDFASFVTSNAKWANGFANVTPGSTGAAPPWLGSAAKAVIEQGTLGIQTFSKAHWQDGDRVELTAYDPMDDANSEIAWIDVEATTAPAMGVLARTGDPRHAGAPSWSHDGKTVAYVSTDANQDGRLADGDAEIYTVPYNDRAGGAAQPLMGASDSSVRSYYPAFSADDKLIAFDEAASGSMYDNASAEVWVVPSSGGVATRLDANDPPACAGHPSPGVTNSWPKWAPAVVTTADGRTFYWVVFSSTRDPFTPDHFADPQLYLAAIVVDSKGNVTTYGALYFWNQPEKEHNHTPAWDYFVIPPVPPVPH